MLSASLRANCFLMCQTLLFPGLEKEDGDRAEVKVWRRGGVRQEQRFSDWGVGDTPT